MRNSLFLFIFFVFVILIGSCSKDKKPTADVECFPGAATIRQIVNQPAVIKKSGQQFYIVEQNSIDLRLIPCELPDEFQVDNLPVTISGEVKTAAQEPVCCTENLIITKIAR